MSPEIFIGVDPGCTGGYCILTIDALVKVAKLDLDLFFRDMSKLDKHASIAYIENVRHYGIKANIDELIKSFGASLFILGYNGIDYELIEPNQWERYMGVPTLKECRKQVKGYLSSNQINARAHVIKKNAHKDRAKKLFPDLNTRQITHATADALLIGEFCRRIEGKVDEYEHRQTQHGYDCTEPEL